jgi:hypothetical protein
LTKIDKALKTFQTETLLIFDNLNLLLTSFDSSALDYLELFNELFSLTSQYPSLSLAIGTNRDLFPESGSVIEFYRSLKTEFELIVEVTRNISGYTKDVHGQLNIIRGANVKNVKYRLTENKVEVFEHFVI